VQITQQFAACSAALVIKSAIATATKMELKEYHGRWLTEAEILLSREFEKRHEEHANELRAKLEERKHMAQRSLKLQQVFHILLASI
jgi:hypothetical protein